MIKDFEAWLHNRGYRLNTVRSITGEVSRFIQWSINEGIAAEKAHYNDLFNYIKHGQSQSNSKNTTNQKLTVLKHYYSYLAEKGQRDDNPAIELRVRNTIRRVPHNLLNMDELEELYRRFPTTGINNKRNKAVLGLLIYQGLNASELAALEPQDLKLEEGKIYIPATGRSNSRTLKLEAHQVMHLQNYLLIVRPGLLSLTDKQSEKLFISSGEGDRLSNTFTRMMEIIKNLSPKVISMKQIRASIVTEWLKKNNIRQVQYMCGHRYVSSTEYYRTDKLEGLQEQLENLHPLQ